jgi:hypothetical protein
VDGYDNAGRFHINMGWDGRDDGWYSLNNISPSGNDFNYEQAININIKPNAGSTGSNEFALNTFTVNKTSVSQNELFAVSFRPRSAGFFPGGEFGAALVNNNDEIVKVIGVMNRGELNPGSAWTLSHNPLVINCFVPETVNAGQYNLRIVSRITGGEWKIVTRSDISENIPNAINLTVNAETGAVGGGYGMALVGFTASETSVSRDGRFNLGYTFMNVGLDVFEGEAGAALVDSNNEIVAVLRSWNSGRYVAGARYTNLINVTITVPNTVEQGNYHLRMVVRPTGGEWKIATIAVDDAPTSINFTVE